MTSGTVRSLNATTAGGNLTFESPIDEFRRFDRFPRELRWRLATGNTKLASAGFEQHFNWARSRGGAVLTIARLNQIEMNEIAVFAGEYQAQCGTRLPHLAAEISVQSYGEMGPSKHPPKNYGRPVFRPQRKKRVSRRALRVARSS